MSVSVQTDAAGHADLAVIKDASKLRVTFLSHERPKS